MLPILILYSSFWLSDALMNDIAVAAKNQMLAENVIPPYLNYKGYYLKDPVAANAQNAVYCPNTTILLNILNILTNSLSKGDKMKLEPEKFKYVLTTIKTFLEKIPTNPENYEMYNKFKELEAQLDNITGLRAGDLREFDDKLKGNNALQHDLPAQSFTNCRDILSVLVNFINTAYSHVLRYCSITEKRYNYKENKIPNNNEVYAFNPNKPNHRNLTSNSPAHKTLTQESVTAESDLVNFIRSQEGVGVNNIMSILQNYRPTGVSYIPANELKDPIANDIHNPLLQGHPGRIQVPSLSINKIDGKNTQPHNLLNPNINTEAWQSMYYKFKGSPGTNKNNQFTKYLTEQFYKENDLGVSIPKYNGVYNPSHIQNAPIDHINAKDPNVVINEMKPSPNVDVNPSFLDFMNQNTNQQENVMNSYMKISKEQLANPINAQTYGMNNYLKVPQNYLNPSTLPGLPQNIQNQMPALPQSTLNQYPSNQPVLQANNNLAQLINYNRLNYNQIKFHNGHNIFTDNANQQNNGQLSVNQLLSVANLGKLNAMPHKNGVVELTYVLKKPKPVYEPAYYVKYRMPYQTFLHNLQNMLAKKTNLRKYDTNDLYQDLLVGSNVTDSSNDLKGLNFEDILKLTSDNGTLITAKLLENNDARVDRTLKIVQKLNSMLPAENIINYNLNVTKNIRLDSQKDMNVSQLSNVKNKILNNVHPDVQRRGVYQNYPYNSVGQFPSRLQPNPYYNYFQAKPNIPGTPLIKSVPSLIMKNPTLYPSNIAKFYPQFGR